MITFRAKSGPRTEAAVLPDAVPERRSDVTSDGTCVDCLWSDRDWIEPCRLQHDQGDDRHDCEFFLEHYTERPVYGRWPGKQEHKINLFAGVAYENLRQEAAAGSGQYVASLATLYGVPEANHGAFGKVLQQRHAELFATDLREDNRAHLRMVSVLNQVLTQEPSLMQ